MSASSPQAQTNNQRLPFSFSTELVGNILRCAIESPAEDQQYACNFLRRENGSLELFYREGYSSERQREYDLSALLSKENGPVLISVKVFVRDHGNTQKRAIIGKPFYYPPLAGPKVSVIIPVRDEADALKKTLPFLAAQEYLNTEFLFVDFRSADGSLTVMREFAKTEERARIIQKLARSAGVVRDLDKETVLGEYVLFLNAGDRPSPRLISEAAARARETDADVVVFSADRYEDATGKTTPIPGMCSPRLSPQDRPVFSGKTDPWELYSFTTPALWNKLFRRELAYDRSLLVHMGEDAYDNAFTYTALALADRIAPLDEVLLTCCSDSGTAARAHWDSDPLAPLCFLLELKKSLMAHSVYEETEPSFLSFALRYAVDKLESLTSLDSFKSAYGALKRFGIREAGLTDKPVDYYPEEYRTSFERIKAIQQYSALEYIEAYGLSSLISLRRVPAAQEEPEAAPKVSVVLPVYNTAQYLRECLDSIVNQTLREIEVICVNDGSTDDSLSVLLEYQKRDPRVVVFDSSENRGLSVSRNIAFDQARGEYLCCVDSDDWIEAEQLENAYAYAKQYDLDMLFFDAVPFYDSPEIEEQLSNKRYAEYYHNITVDLSFPRTGHQMLLDLIRSGTYRSNMCQQLIKRDHLDRCQIRLYPGILYEDILFTFESLLKAGSCARINFPYYHRRFREGSIVTARKGLPSVRSYLICAVEMMCALRRAAVSREKEQTYFFLIRHAMSQMMQAFHALSEEERKEFLQQYLTPMEASWFRIIEREQG